MAKWDNFLLSNLYINPVANKKTDSSAPDFEKALKKLENIVTKMEGGELTLEEALKSFEEGITLSRQCQDALKHAEQRVSELMAEQSTPDSEPKE
jgi:exodeoxyribonuclease VII small subunit